MHAPNEKRRERNYSQLQAHPCLNVLLCKQTVTMRFCVLLVLACQLWERSASTRAHLLLFSLVFPMEPPCQSSRYVALLLCIYPLKPARTDIVSAGAVLAHRQYDCSRSEIQENTSQQNVKMQAEEGQCWGG